MWCTPSCELAVMSCYYSLATIPKKKIVLGIPSLDGATELGTFDKYILPKICKPFCLPTSSSLERISVETWSHSMSLIGHKALHLDLLKL